MSAWAKPGVKCVCVTDDRPWANVRGEEPIVTPVKNQVLTIRAAIPGSECVCLTFVEIPVVQNGRKHAWDIAEFRPLISRTQEQDVAAFRHHLADAPELVS